MLDSYLAGFLDGEGCICITFSDTAHRHQKCVVMITQSNREILARIQSQEGGSLHQMKGKSREGRPPCWSWTLGERKVPAFLRRMLPYLIVKREEAKLALGFLDFKNTYILGHGGMDNHRPSEAEQHRRIEMRQVFKNGMHQLKSRYGYASHRRLIGQHKPKRETVSAA
ncbi:MAG: hypothetical protein V3S55_09535 [Nitrospiraceae bacterium]